MIALLITVLINLGLLTSSADWNKLSTQKQQQYKQEIIIDDIVIGM